MVNLKETEKSIEMGNVILHALRQAKYIEEKLESTFYYLDPTVDNYQNATALICQEIIIQSCIQIEAMAKKYYCLYKKNVVKFSFSLWGKAFPETSKENIFLKTSRIRFLPVSTTLFPEPYGIGLQPWFHDENKMPLWWNAGYNAIKHGENTTLKFCTYENALLSLAGLYTFAAFVGHFSGSINIKAKEFKPKYFSGTRLDSLFKK